jgi:HD-GYP domain-containing protein (c-di-GMP phosphodiesterase class II)
MILTALDDVRPGMVLGVGIRNKEGHTLLGPGIPLTESYVNRLRDLGYCAMWIDTEDTSDIPYQDMLSESTRLTTTAVVRDIFTVTERETGRLRGLSSDQARNAVEGPEIPQTFADQGLLERLTQQAANLVNDVLNWTSLTGLGSIRMHSSRTYQHCVDVAVIGTMLGRLLEYDRAVLNKLAIGCMVHDIGQVFVQDDLFERARQLTAEEMSRVRTHTVLGHLFVRDTLKLGARPSHIVYQHHEWQDGAGYPRGLTGTNRHVGRTEVHAPGRMIPMAEIAAIADFQDALNSDRPWRPRLPSDDIWRTLRDAAGAHLNREMVDRLLGVLPPYPLGTQVLITSGPYEHHVAVVSHVERRAMWTPVVRVLKTPDGQAMAARELDLRHDDVTIRGIVVRGTA